MGRLTFEDLTPDDMPAVFVDYSGEVADQHRDSNPPRAPWTLTDVYAYRTALVELGFTDDEVRRQVLKDCGAEFANVAFVRGGK